MIDLFFNILLLVFLILAFSGDLIQYAVRILVSVLDQPNLSTHLVSLSMLINRFGAALGLLLIGFMIDTGASVYNLTAVYTLFALSMGGIYALVARFPKFGMKLLVPFIAKYYGFEVRTPNVPSFGDSEAVKCKFDIALAFNLALLGFLLPSILAVAVPEYRATLLQTGFILNSFATLYSALKIEKSLAIILNGDNEAAKWQAYVNFMQARALGAILTAGMLFLIMLI